MTAFDSLYGITNFADLDLSQIMTGTLIYHYDWGFVNVGGYVNVTYNKLNINNADMSRLRAAKDNLYRDGQVWEFAHNNIVYESGVAVGNPIAISGVYVNSNFQSLTSGTYQGVIEYKRGRVIFNNPIPQTSQLNIEYSYKAISVVEAKNYPILREIQFRDFDPNTNNFLQIASGDYNKSPNARMMLPLCGIEVTPRLQTTPHELGNRIQRVETTVVFHALGDDDNQVKKIITTIARQKESTFFLLDMNLMAKSGVFSLDINGRLNSGGLSYPNLVKDEGSYRFGRSYIMMADASDGKWISNNLYHGTVRTVIETIY